MAKTLFGGADDYLPKPFNVLQLQGRVQAALRLKEAQDRSDHLNRQLMAVNAAPTKTAVNVGKPAARVTR